MVKSRNTRPTKLEQSRNHCVLICYRRQEDAADMATLAQKIKAERQMRDLLEQNGLPQPDHVEYGFTCIRLFFNETKVVVVVDIDEPPNSEEAAMEADVA